MKNEQPYASNGVLMVNPKISVKDKISLLYNGLLVESGADRIFVHVGYGEEWEEEFIEMEYTQDGFKADVEAKAPGVFNVCFKDSADNWDNNSGLNYIFKITNKKGLGKVKESESKAASSKTKVALSKTASSKPKAASSKPEAGSSKPKTTSKKS